MSGLVSISVSPQSVFQINITNTQNTATPVPFQQMIQLPISQLGLINPYIRNLGPLRFSYNGSYIPAWLESINNGVATIWVKLPVSIPANSSITIEMQVDPSLNFDGVYWGENPLLSPTYGEYDNGASVFSYYQRWGNLSSLPSGWSSISGTVITYASTYIEIAPSPSTDGWYGISLNPIPSSLSSTTTVWEFYGNMYDSIGAGSCIGTATGNGGNFNGYSFFEGGSPTNLIYLGNNNNPFSASTGYDDTNNNKVYTMQMNSATSLQMFINYTQIYSTTSATSESLTYFDIDPSNSAGSYPSTPIYIYWLRTRAYPPNGVMPSVSFGGLSTT